MSEDLVVEIAWLEAGGYYEIHLLEDDSREAVKFTTADTEAEALECVRALLLQLKVALNTTEALDSDDRKAASLSSYNRVPSSLSYIIDNE